MHILLTPNKLSTNNLRMAPFDGSNDSLIIDLFK